MNSNIVRAWKDEFYRQSLSDEERAQLPENPVGELELTDAELGSVFAAGGHENNSRFGEDCVHHYYYTQNWELCHNSHFEACHHVVSRRPYEFCQHYNTRDFDDCWTRRIDK